MKITKAQNPYNVKIGQVWADRDSSRKNTFVIKRLLIDKDGLGFALVFREKTRAKTWIRLNRFNKYFKK